MNSITPEKLKFKDGDYISSSDIDGSLYKEDQFMNFDQDGDEITLYYTLDVDAEIYEDSGDFWTPPYTSVDINSVDITLSSVYINGEYSKIDESLKKELELLIDRTL